MPELKINNRSVRVEFGTTVLEAAKKISVEIPTLCHLEGFPPETSCMLCVVKDETTGQLIPACSTRAVEGMEIDTECGEVQAARRDILNLLLSEHVGDCEAPCTRTCPAHLDIPAMLREIARGNPESAAWIARRDLAIPSVLSHVCPAPCQKACRRAELDSAIPIRELHRGGQSGSPVPEDGNDGKIGLTPRARVAVVGSGPAGLACAWQLRLLGHGCTVFDPAPKAGGALRGIADLPSAVLDGEIEALWRAGIEFKLGEPVSLHGIAEDYQGVVFASAEFAAAHFSDAFHAEEHRLAVKAVANGKAAARALDTFLEGGPPPDGGRFDSRIGRLRASEVRELEKNCLGGEGSGTGAPQAEAARCLHCDCRKPLSCKLRRYAERYGADQREFPPDERGHLQVLGQGGAVVFEPGKCIKCGLCVKIAKRAGEVPGLAFIGRGFNTQVAVPFGEPLQAGLRVAAKECVEACPTGALAFRDAEESET